MIPLRWRALVFAVVTIVVLTYMHIWDTAAAKPYHVYPIPNLLGSTWYGPFLVLLIPISLGWFSLGAKRRSARALGMVCTVFALIVSFYFTYHGMSHVDTLPLGSRRWAQI